MSERPHGYARYKLDNCRCYTCGWAHSAYWHAREDAIAAGTWHPWTDAAAMREHIRRLQSCGMGLRAIAAAAGVSRLVLQAVLNGRSGRREGQRQEKVRPRVAAAVLGVEPTLENLAPCTVIDPTGTFRRLHAMVAAGWPLQHIGAALGMTPSNFGAMLSFQHVTARRALQVREVYDRLWKTDPLEHGATRAGTERARAMARARRWAPVGAWDDETIDDPAAHPNWTGLCGTMQGYTAHRTHRLPTCRPCLDAYNATMAERKKSAA